MFQRMYICFGAIRDDFKIGCMKIIGIDDFFLWGPHKEQLLTIIGIDGNNGIYSIVKGESNDL